MGSSVRLPDILDWAIHRRALSEIGVKHHCQEYAASYSIEAIHYQTELH